MSAARREELHRLVDRLPEAQTQAAVRYLQALAVSAGFRHHRAVTLVDEEELSEEAVQAIEEGIADYEAGRTHTLEEAEPELGL